MIRMTNICSSVRSVVSQCEGSVIMLLLLSFVFGLAAADITGTNPATGTCLCFKTGNVNIRGSACGSVIGGANQGQCHKYTGTKEICSLSGATYDFFEFEYGTSGGWSAGTYLNTAADSACEAASCGDVNIVSRAAWGARAPTGRTSLSLPLARTFIHHTVTSHCFNQADCSAEIRGMQNYHMDSLGWSDIGYNFLVGEDGQAYEGRGWDTQGAHASSWNSQSHGISVIGDFTSVMPNQAALDAVDSLIACGIQQSKITSGYAIHGHRNGVCTACPGNTLFSWVSAKPNYGGNLSGSCPLNEAPQGKANDEI